MNHSIPTLAALAISVLLLPSYVSAQQPVSSSSEQTAEPRQNLGDPETQSGKTSRESQTRQVSPSIAGSAAPTEQSNTLISVQSLTSSKVLDAENREMGSVKNIMVDPKSGKLVRADISLGGGGLLGMGDGDQRFSVPWDQLSLKRQDAKFVLVLNQEVVEKIRTKTNNQTTQKKQEPNQQQRPADSEQKK